MARSDGYNTRTRQLILDYLINNRQHAVSEKSCKKRPNVK